MTELKGKRCNINDILLLFYIAVQIVIVFVFGSVFKGYLAAFYIASAVLVGFTFLFPRLNKPSFLHFIKTVYPLILIYMFYRIIDTQTQLLNFAFQDDVLTKLEKSLLGVYPSFALQGIMEVWLNEISYLFYCAGIILPIWTIIKLYREEQLKYFENFVLAVETGCIICLLIASVFPVAGPSVALNDYYYLSIVGPFFSVVVPGILSLVSPSNAGFPAVYFCVVILSAYYLWDFGLNYILFTFIIITGVFWGGVYLRYHYLADGLAALLVAFLSSIAAGIVYYAKHGAPENVNN